MEEGIFERPQIEIRGTPVNQPITEETLFYDTTTERLYTKIVGGVVPPNQDGPGYMVIAGMTRPLSGQVPTIWLIAEAGYHQVSELLTSMSKAHGVYRVITFYTRFKKTKEGYRVFDGFARHVQQFNLEAAAKRLRSLDCSDAPWVGDRGNLAFQLEKIHEELRIDKRTLFWMEPSPPSVTALSGIDEWETVADDKNTMVGALCYAVCGLLAQRPLLDLTGRIIAGQQTQKTKHGRVPFKEWMNRKK